MKARFKIVMLYILSFACSVTPALAFFLINHDKYIKTVPDKVKITVGLVAIAVILIIKLAGKLKINSKIVVFGIFFLLCYLLESMLNDLIVFSFLALIGEILDLIVMAIIKKSKRDLFIKESAEANAKANADELDKALKRLSGRT